MNNWKINEDDKIVRQYYGGDGWTFVLRTKEGMEYHISRNQIIKNIYNDNNELGCRN